MKEHDCPVKDLNLLACIKKLIIYSSISIKVRTQDKTLTNSQLEETYNSRVPKICTSKLNLHQRIILKLIRQL